MEKLVKLLNEFEKSIGFKPDWKVEGNGVAPRQSYYGTMISEMVVINKKNGFIKWLVENDKIELPTSCAIDKNNDYSEREIKSDYESLLMLLAISDTPIDDLISYLK